MTSQTTEKLLEMYRENYIQTAMELEYSREEAEEMQKDFENGES